MREARRRRGYEPAATAALRRTGRLRIALWGAAAAGLLTAAASFRDLAVSEVLAGMRFPEGWLSRLS